MFSFEKLKFVSPTDTLNEVKKNLKDFKIRS